MAELGKPKHKDIPWTPEHGFDLSFLTIKHVSNATGVSGYSIRDNVAHLLKTLPVEERVPVLEHMLECKEKKVRRDVKVLDLDKLPVSQSQKVTEFLGVTDDELWQACKEYERRMKEGKEPHETFGLRKELIVQTADEVMRRNAEWIAERVDKKRPMALLGKLHEAPQDRPAWVLRLLRRHGFKQVDLVVWVAADMFLSKWVERGAVNVIRRIFGKQGFK